MTGEWFVLVLAGAAVAWALYTALTGKDPET